MRKLHHALFGAVVVVSLTACADRLDVANLNQPDRERALATPTDVEQIISSSYNSVHQGTLGGSNDNVQNQMQVMGFENYAGNANFGHNIRVPIPRQVIENTRGNAVSIGNYRDWVFMHRAARSAAFGLQAMEREGFTLGSAVLDARARAFAFFVMGIAHGNLALVYDSATVMRPDDDTEVINPLVGYNEVMDAGLAYLDSALALIAANSSMEIPAGWLRTSSASTSADFVRLIRSYKARLRASVARTPADRANAVDWAAVVADADAGITSDYNMNIQISEGWTIAWTIQHYLFLSWHQMWNLIVGMADVSGRYDAWLATPRELKAPFLIETPDTRFPAGATRAAQTAVVSDEPGNVPPPGVYFRNRPPGEDPATFETLAFSQYDFARFQAFYNAGRNGLYPVMTAAEIRLLSAEGRLRPGPQQDVPGALTRINVTRTAAGLPALAGQTSMNDPVPGGLASCVPRVPNPASDLAGSVGTAICGSVLEALKWEYRMETAYTGYGMWYFAGRGWGDLPDGTAYNWPVPWQELDTRRLPLYNLGGPGGLQSVGKGNYGL